MKAPSSANISPPLNRRRFIRNSMIGSAALTCLGNPQGPRTFASETAKPSIPGGADMDHIVEAIRKIQVHGAALAKA